MVSVSALNSGVTVYTLQNDRKPFLFLMFIGNLQRQWTKMIFLFFTLTIS